MKTSSILSIAAACAILSLEAAAPADTAPAAPAAEAKSFEADPPAAEKSKAPTPDEWKTAGAVKLARSVAACSTLRVREWLKVHCESVPAAGAQLLAGPPEGVMVWVDQDSAGGNDAMKKTRPVDVVIPVRRGDGRMIQIAQFGEGYDGPIGWNVAVTLSEQWVDGEAAPIIAMW